MGRIVGWLKSSTMAVPLHIPIIRCVFGDLTQPLEIRGPFSPDRVMLVNDEDIGTD